MIDLPLLIWIGLTPAAALILAGNLAMSRYGSLAQWKAPVRIYGSSSRKTGEPVSFPGREHRSR